MSLYERCDRFINELGVPVTRFCKNIDLSRSCLYAWRDGDLRLSQSTLDRIEKYVSKYGF